MNRRVHHSARTSWTLCLCLLSLLASAHLSWAAIVRQPYLQSVTSNAVTIVWRTDSPGGPNNNSRVQYGTSSGSLNQTAIGVSVVPPSNSAVKDHFVTITGLSPATRYFYNVGTTSGVEGGGTTQHFFITAPVPGSDAPFRVWALGDSGNNSSDQRAVRDSMLKVTSADPPDLILHFADMAYESGTDSDFTTKHFATYQNILRNTPLWPSFGNHEAVSSSATLGTGPYFEAHALPTQGQAGGQPSGTEAYYSFDYGNAHFIVLDSQDNAVLQNSSMLDWLQADLAATTQEWVIAYFHHPPYTKGTHDSDVASDSNGRMVYMREVVLPILEAGGVDLVLAGHSHNYERSYFINGAYGYPNSVTPSFSTLRADGHILDDGSGEPAGDGAYEKDPSGNIGAVYVVAGHGGNEVGGAGGHPVMFFTDVNTFGSVLLDFDDTRLTLRNLRSDGAFTDIFSIDKSGGGGTPGNQAPAVNAGPDQTTILGTAVSLDGTVTDDGLPNPPGTVTTSWSTVSGPGTVTFGNAAAVDTTASFSAAGTYVLRLTASDSVLSNSDDVTITVNVAGAGGFTAYNDLAWGTGQLTTNITRITSPNGGSGLPSSGQLVNFDTGAGTGVTLTVTGGDFNGGSHATQHSGSPAPGTDAFNVFNGKLTAFGSTSYQNVAPPAGNQVLTFTGMDPSKRYELVFYGHRNNYGWTRGSLVTISGATGFVNQSSAATDNPAGGALFSGPGDDSTRLPADNDNGYVARFVDVAPGTDGQVALILSWDGTPGNEYAGKYANAVMLREQGS